MLRVSTTADALELVKLLKPKIGEQTATKLLDYADKQRDKNIDRLWVVVIGGFSLLLTVIFYLHIDIKSQMSDTKVEMKRRFAEQKADIKEIRRLLLQKR